MKKQTSVFENSLIWFGAGVAYFLYYRTLLPVRDDIYF